MADQEKKIESLTPADVSKAFARVLDPKKLVIAQAGDFAKAAKEAKEGKEPAKKDEPKTPGPKK